jgi:iron complex outermembrane receptor protein
MRALKASLLATSTLAGVAALLAAAALPAAAFAQTTTTTTTTTTTVEPDALPAAVPADTTEVEELIITGSRIRRTEYTSAAPIQVITREQNTLEGLADTAELLQTTSSASGSQQINNQLGSFVIEGGGGVSTLSLRGLGGQRTLILVNGRRAGPAGVGGQVGAFDLNVIPESSIERVEILKDGASSIYGSDAVAGVVNIITRNDVDGGDVEIYYNQPFDSGGEVLRLAGTYGKTFDRWNFNISADYWKQYPLNLGDREYTACSNDYYHDAVSGEMTDIISRRTGKPFCYENSVQNAVYLPEFGFYQQYDPTEAEGPYDPFASLLSDLGYVGPGWYAAALGDSFADTVDYFYGTGAYNYSTYEYYHADERIDAGSSIIAPIERMTVFGTGSFDLTPNAELYGEMLLNRRKSQQNAVRGVSASIDAGTYGNPFDGLEALPIVDNLPFNFFQEVNYSRFVGGVRGDVANLPFLNGWNYDVFFQRSKSAGEYGNDAILDDAMYALGDSASNYADQNGTNTGGCASVPVTPISGRTCVPISWFDPDTMANGLTDEQQDFITYRTHSTTDYTQTSLEGSISGDVMELPAGALALALGFHWRKDELDDSPDNNGVIQNLWGQTTAGRTVGEDTVREIYGEVEVPLLRGVPFAEQVTFTGSARWSDYDSYGQNTTYKAGLNWQMSSQFRIRGTYGTSYRAPALYEMFLASLTGFQGQSAIDPCIRYEDADDEIIAANCAAAGIPEGYIGVGGSATITQGGGGKGFLEPETSLAQSIGIVYTPDFVDFSLAIDYFDIRVKDEVTQFGAANIVNLCYGLPGYPNSFCDLFERDEDPDSDDFHSIVSVLNNYVNVAEQHNRGFDVTTRYKHSFSWADMTIDTQLTWQIEDTINFSGLATLDANNGSGEPGFSGNTQVRFDRGDWTVYWATDLIGHQFPAEPITGGTSRHPTDVIFKRWREFTAYHDLSVRRKFDNMAIVIGVQNVFDEHPPAASFNEFRVGTAALNQYDLIGRRAFVNFSKSF